jgi:hypothetical protein
MGIPTFMLPDGTPYGFFCSGGPSPKESSWSKDLLLPGCEFDGGPVLILDAISLALCTASANAGTFPSAPDGGAPEAEKLLILHPEIHRTIFTTNNLV